MPPLQPIYFTKLYACADSSQIVIGKIKMCFKLIKHGS